jgi:hypothetical protein
MEKTINFYLLSKQMILKAIKGTSNNTKKIAYTKIQENTIKYNKK